MEFNDIVEVLPILIIAVATGLGQMFRKKGEKEELKKKRKVTSAAHTPESKSQVAHQKRMAKRSSTASVAEIQRSGKVKKMPRPRSPEGRLSESQGQMEREAKLQRRSTRRDEPQTAPPKGVVGPGGWIEIPITKSVSPSQTRSQDTEADAEPRQSQFEQIGREFEAQVTEGLPPALTPEPIRSQGHPLEGFGPQSLKQAILFSELMQPPLSLRDEDQLSWNR